MKSLTRGNIRFARQSLRARRGRSLLTMFGIIISVSSVITISAVGQGVKNQVVGQINHYGKDLITIRPAQTTDYGTSFFSQSQLGSNLTAGDLKATQHSKLVSSASPLAIVNGAVKGDKGAYNAGPVLAIDGSLPKLLNQTISYGNTFSEDDDGKQVAILGTQAAEALFDQQVPLGQTFTFRGQEYMVRGMFNQFPNALLSSDVDFNKAIFIPYITANQVTHNGLNIYEILAKPTALSQIGAATVSLDATLNKLHGGGNDVSVLQQSDNLAQTNKVLLLLTQLITGAAAVALLVGGIGIMNIMLVSVTERMHEVGIRKAIGATNRQIMSEFVAEAAVLSISGALIGIVVAAIVDVALRVATDFAPVIHWQVVVVAAGVAIIVGILFGSIPALKAARKDPIAALRGE